MSVEPLAVGANSPYYDMVNGTPGLIGWWRMGETTGNLIDSKFTLGSAVVNGPVNITYGQPACLNANYNIDSNGAIKLNTASANAGFNVAYVAAMETFAEISVEFWINFTGSLSGSCLVSRYRSSPTNAAWRIIVPSTGFVVWSLFETGGNGPYITSANAVTTNAPHHFVCVYHGANKICKIYTDGVDNTGANTGDALAGTQLRSAPSSQLDIFGIPGGLTGATVVLDEVAFYNKMLTPQQIMDHYRSGAWGEPVGGAAVGVG